jgi:hypothetical protein
MKSSVASTMVQVALPLASVFATAYLLRRKLGLRSLIEKRERPTEQEENLAAEIAHLSRQLREQEAMHKAAIQAGPPAGAKEINCLLRYIDEFLSLDCASKLVDLKLFPDGKEVTESISIYTALRKYFPTVLEGKAQDGDMLIVVGDGVTPRTAALLSFMCGSKGWTCCSIDPMMRFDDGDGEGDAGTESVQRQQAQQTLDGSRAPSASRDRFACTEDATLPWNGIRGLRVCRAKIQDLTIRAKRAVVLMMHCHVSIKDVEAAIVADELLGIITCPCCNWAPKQKTWRGRPADHVYSDPSLLSMKREIKVWAQTPQAGGAPAAPPRALLTAGPPTPEAALAEARDWAERRACVWWQPASAPAAAGGASFLESQSAIDAWVADSSGCSSSSSVDDFIGAFKKQWTWLQPSQVLDGEPLQLPWDPAAKAPAAAAQATDGPAPSEAERERLARRERVCVRGVVHRTRTHGKYLCFLELVADDEHASAAVHRDEQVPVLPAAVHRDADLPASAACLQVILHNRFRGAERYPPLPPPLQPIPQAAPQQHAQEAQAEDKEEQQREEDARGKKEAGRERRKARKALARAKASSAATGPGAAALAAAAGGGRGGGGGGNGGGNGAAKEAMQGLLPGDRVVVYGYPGRANASATDAHGRLSLYATELRVEAQALDPTEVARWWEARQQPGMWWKDY